jgi:hypothetical protein
MTVSSKELPGQSEFPIEIPPQCRDCIMIALAALTYGGLEEKIQAIRKEDASGALMQRWVAQAALVGEMSLADAEDFIESREPQLRGELEEKLGEMVSMRDAKASAARYVISHCEQGVVKLVSSTKGADIEAEVCGSTMPERVPSVDDAEIVRVRRQPAGADAIS